VILDGSVAESAPSQLLHKVTSLLGDRCRRIAFREVPDWIAELAAEVDRRVQAEDVKSPAFYVLLYGMQRYTQLRRTEDAFGFSLNEGAKATPNAGFSDLLRSGPGVGVHVLAWADTLATLERTLDRQTLREFDYRVLFQMSAADSSNLIDSPVANQLGFHRAILYSQEQGGMEKFRPYAVIRDEWLAEVETRLKNS
jgi:DNA segregation ATPase FtsK/SpoIIIE, S-DNA-T family